MYGSAFGSAGTRLPSRSYGWSFMTPADGNYWSLTLSGWEARRDSQVRPETLLLCVMDVGDDGHPRWQLLWRSADVGAVERARNHYGEYPNARLAE